jgi:hypothetical protein
MDIFADSMKFWKHNMKKMKYYCPGICSTLMIVLLVLCCELAHASEFIKTCLVRIGGAPLRAGDDVALSQYDIIFANKSHYDDIRGNSWRAIKSINPGTEIYVYTTINHVSQRGDSRSTVSLNNVGRYNISRGHHMGSLNLGNPDLFLRDSIGRRLSTPTSSDLLWLDFGHYRFQAYAVAATVNDHVGHPWTADGVYSDLNTAIQNPNVINGWPAKYNTQAKWSAAMNSMVSSMTTGLNAKGQKFASNRGRSMLVDGYKAWLNLDHAPNPPDVLLEEGAFAVGWGPGNVQFFTEAEWRRQVDLLQQIENSKVCYLSHADVGKTGRGIDSNGKPFTFSEVFWYSLGSFLLGKKDNSYFTMRYAYNYNLTDLYYDAYDLLDLGRAIGGYRVNTYDGANIYWREFEDGYVYVNPTRENVTSIPLPRRAKLLTPANLQGDPDTLPDQTSINLNAHRAAILYKSGVHQSSVPSKPPAPRIAPTEVTVYEDAEDGTIKGWKVYDAQPAGARITNVFDPQRGSRVVQLQGAGKNNGYSLMEEDGGIWQNQLQYMLEWSMNYSESFTVYVHVKTTQGHRYMVYSPVDRDLLGHATYVYYGLGRGTTDGRWRTFVRDLQADLKEAQPNASILEVNSFLIRGSGKVDGIKLLN